MSYRTCFVLAALLLAAPSFAAAGPRPPAAKADEDFLKGRKAMEAGDYSAALNFFRESHARDPGRGKLLNIAICEEKLGLLWDALQHFKELDPQVPAKDDRRPILDQHLKDLAPRIPHLTIKLSAGAPPGALVALDGGLIDAASLGAELSVNPGQHVILVTAPGYPERRYDVALAEGKKETIEVGEPDGPAGGDSSKRSVIPAVALGVLGAAGLAMGGAFVSLRGDRRAEAVSLRDEIVGDGGRCVEGAANYDAARCPVLKGTTSEGDAFGSAALSAFIVGGVAVAGGVMYLLWPARKPEEKAGVRVTVAPVVGQREQGLVVMGTF